MAKNAEEVVNKTDVLVKVSILAQSVLSEINVSKTACMFFSKGHSVDIKQGIFRDGPSLQNTRSRGRSWI